MSFKSFHLYPQIESGVEAMGFHAPTTIQRQSIPFILQGRDVIGMAQTGTGKTAAFVLPVLQRLMKEPRKQIRALVIAPTRELAEQTNAAFGELGRYTRVKSVTIYGGVNRNPQIKAARSGAQIAVACPGRLLDLMDEGAVDLSSVEILVLDEADRMFDMGFLPDIRRILNRLPSRRQTLLFSATIPEDVRRLAEEILHDPVDLQVGQAAPVSSVSHALYPVERHLKTALLMKLLRRTDTESVLVFTRTKRRATRLSSQMKHAGFSVALLQGDLSQNERRRALGGFRSGKYRILVATDIAARGIDISRISHVINYDMPDTVDAYTHRIGRTGRAAKTGDAFTLVTPTDMEVVCSIENLLGKELERRELEGFDYEVPAPEGSRRDSEPAGGASAPAPSAGLYRGALPFFTARPRGRRALRRG